MGFTEKISIVNLVNPVILSKKSRSRRLISFCVKPGSTPGIRGSCICFLIFLSIFLSTFATLAQEAVIPSKSVISVRQVAKAPDIDGLSSDECWERAGSSEIEIAFSWVEKIKGMISVSREDGNIYFLLKIPCETENLEHGMWHWDPVEQVYSEGEEKEDTVQIMLAQKPAKNSFADLWIWRSARNSSSGYADDFHCSATGGESRDEDFIPAEGLKYAPDSGKLPWFSKYFAKFAGEKLPRFYQRRAEGSAGDVKCSAKWKDGVWTIELSRKLDTGRPDDLVFSPGSPLYFIVIWNSSLGAYKGGTVYKLEFNATDKAIENP